MVVMRTFDGTVAEKGKYIAASMRKRNVRARSRLIARLRKRERPDISPSRGKLAKARSRGPSVARGKLRSYRILDAHEAQVSIDRSTRPRN